MSAVVGVPVATVWADPAAPRPLDAAAVADTPDLAAWTAALGPPERLGLHGRTVTQALLGEPVEVVGERGPWLEVRLPWQPGPDGDGYPGWVRRAHVVAGEAAGPGDATYVELRPTRTLVTDRGPLTVSFATRLPVVEGVLHLPDGRRAVVTDEPAARIDLLTLARRHVGLPYLWGGTSGWGLDCSGLVHVVHRCLGVVVPRDSPDQRSVTKPVDAAEPGDLVFVADDGPTTHVGLVAVGGDPARVLHAPEGDQTSHGRVVEERFARHVAAFGRVQPPDEVPDQARHRSA